MLCKHFPWFWLPTSHPVSAECIHSLIYSFCTGFNRWSRLNLCNNQQLDGEMFSWLPVKSVHRWGQCWSQGGHHNIQEILLKMHQAAKCTILLVSALREQTPAKAEISHTCQNLCKPSSPCKSLNLENIRFRFVLALQAIVAKLFTNQENNSGILDFAILVGKLFILLFYSCLCHVFQCYGMPGFESQSRSEMFCWSYDPPLVTS